MTDHTTEEGKRQDELTCFIARKRRGHSREDRSQEPREQTFAEIEDEHRSTADLAERAHSVGRADVPRTFIANILLEEQPRDDDSERDRAEKERDEQDEDRSDREIHSLILSLETKTDRCAFEVEGAAQALFEIALV